MLYTSAELSSTKSYRGYGPESVSLSRNAEKMGLVRDKQVAACRVGVGNVYGRGYKFVFYLATFLSFDSREPDAERGPRGMAMVVGASAFLLLRLSVESGASFGSRRE